MPKVDFYVINDETEKAQLSLACRLASKTYQAQQHLYIYCNDQAQAATLDDMLWSFNDISFIPHSLVQQNQAEALPVLIGYDKSIEITRDMLLNLHREVPATADKFKHIIEIVYQDSETKKIARTHYKAYQDKGFQLESHHLN